MLQSSVNFVMCPTKSYFSPLESLFPDSSVEQGLEAMFNMDSLDHNKEIVRSLINLSKAFHYKMVDII